MVPLSYTVFHTDVWYIVIQFGGVPFFAFTSTISKYHYLCYKDQLKMQNISPFFHQMIANEFGNNYIADCITTRTRYKTSTAYQKLKYLYHRRILRDKLYSHYSLFDFLIVISKIKFHGILFIATQSSKDEKFKVISAILILFKYYLFFKLYSKYYLTH